MAFQIATYRHIGPHGTVTDMDYPGMVEALRRVTGDKCLVHARDIDQGDHVTLSGHTFCKLFPEYALT